MPTTTRPRRIAPIVIATAAVTVLTGLLGLVSQAPSLGLWLGGFLPVGYALVQLIRRRPGRALRYGFAGLAMGVIGLGLLPRVPPTQVEAVPAAMTAPLPDATPTPAPTTIEPTPERTPETAPSPALPAPTTPPVTTAPAPVPSTVPPPPPPTTTSAPAPAAPATTTSPPTRQQTIAAAAAPVSTTRAPKQSTQPSSEPSAAKPAPVTSQSGVKVYERCADLNQDFPNGVGRAGAVDMTKNGPKKPQPKFKVNEDLYNANTDRDADNDGIACEKS